VHSFEIAAVKQRLTEAGGGYEVVHESVGVELGVYVLVAPEPDRQQPHEDDEWASTTRSHMRLRGCTSPRRLTPLPSTARINRSG
jgi:hypothetical protein